MPDGAEADAESLAPLLLNEDGGTEREKLAFTQTELSLIKAEVDSVAPADQTHEQREAAIVKMLFRWWRRYQQDPEKYAPPGGYLLDEERAAYANKRERHERQQLG